MIKYHDKDLNYKYYRLTDAVITIKKCEKQKITIEVSIDDLIELLECDLKARYKSYGNIFTICLGREEISLSSFFTEQPLIYKTVADTTIMGIDVIEGDFEGKLFNDSIIEGIEWDNYKTVLDLEFRKDDKDTR